MAKTSENKEAKGKPAYEKPLFEESKGLTFTQEIWEKFNLKNCCIQCSGCHACRGG